MNPFKGHKSQLFALKVVVFCWFAAAACLMPYMTIHMRQLGITVEETAIVYTVLPFVQVIGSPLAGFIADRIGNYKPVLCISLIVSILTSLALMVIPSSGDPEKYISREEEARHQVIFWVYFIIRIVFQIATGICFTILDATSIALCEKHETSFGKIRFWGILGTGLFSPVCGWLVDYLSHGLDEFSTDYSPTFHFFNLFVLLTLISSCTLDIEVSVPNKNVLGTLKQFVKSFPIWVLFTVVFILGTLWGFVESFLFWYLLDLKAPKILLGLTLTTGAIVSLPFLRCANWFVDKLGYANLMIIALFFYFIRCFGYSLIENPYWCFPFEAMEAFTYHLMWVAAAIYSAELAPEGLRATMIGAVGSLHYGIGRASGSMIGGTLMALFNARLAFRYFGIGAGVSGVLYTICYYGYLRNQNSKDTVDAKTDNALELEVINNIPIDCKVILDEEKPSQIEPKDMTTEKIEIEESKSTQAI